MNLTINRLSLGQIYLREWIFVAILPFFVSLRRVFFTLLVVFAFSFLRRAFLLGDLFLAFAFALLQVLLCAFVARGIFWHLFLRFALCLEEFLLFMLLFFLFLQTFFFFFFLIKFYFFVFFIFNFSIGAFIVFFYIFFIYFISIF